MRSNIFTKHYKKPKEIDCFGFPSTNIFINYLPPNYTKTELVQLCVPFGHIESAKVIIDLKTGLSKCFGFVRFCSIYSAQKAVLKLDGFKIPNTNKCLLARFAGSKMENTGEISNSIYVKSLCLYFTTKDIWNIFSKFGDIREIELINDQKSNLFNGNAIITFSSIYEAQEAVRIMNNIKLTPESWPLFIQYTQKPAEKLLDTKSMSFLSGVKIEKPKKKEKSSIENTKKVNSLKHMQSPINSYNDKTSNSSMYYKNPIEPICKINQHVLDSDYQNYEDFYNQKDMMFSVIAEEL